MGNTLEKTSQILINHENFILENDSTDSVESLHNIISDDSVFESYISAITESLDENIQSDVLEMLRHQRTVIVENLTSSNASGEAIAYAVGTLAILTDRYSDELLRDGVYVKPVTSPILTLSRNRHTAEKIGMDGSKTIVTIPSAKSDLRNERVTLTLEPNKQHNIYTKLAVTKDEYDISANGIKGVELLVDMNGTDVVIPLEDIRFNARGDIEGEPVTLVDPDKPENVTVVRMTGNMNKGTGNISASFPIVSQEGDTDVTVKTYKIKFRMYPIGGDKGIINIKTSPKSRDIIIDDNNPVYKITEKDAIRENWKAIYKRDVIADMITVAKTQISINQNYEIADELEDIEYLIKRYGAWRTFNLDPAGNGTAPESFVSIFRSFIPTLNAVVDSIQTESGLTPNVIMASPKVAVLMKSLQKIAIEFNRPNDGKIGQNIELADITKFKVVKSVAIPDSRLYVVRKGMSEQDSSIVEASFKPLIIKTETTGGKDITFIRTRTRTEIAREDTIGCVELQGIDTYLGTTVVE